MERIEVEEPLDGREFFLERVSEDRHEWLDVEVDLGLGYLVTLRGDLEPPSLAYSQGTVYLEEGAPTLESVQRYLDELASQGFRARSSRGLWAWQEAAERTLTPKEEALARQRDADRGVPEEAAQHWEAIKAALLREGSPRGVLTRASLRAWMYEGSARLARAWRAQAVEVDPAEEPQFAWGNAYLLAREVSELTVVTGWALSEGWWVSHVWCWNEGTSTIHETTWEREAYWGHELTLEEAETYAQCFADL